jgi:hypothetical protein
MLVLMVCKWVRYLIWIKAELFDRVKIKKSFIEKGKQRKFGTSLGDIDI